MKIRSAKTLKKIVLKLITSPENDRPRKGLANSTPRKKIFMTSNNDTANSSTNEYETFADEVREVVPEVDHRGRIRRTKSNAGEFHSEMLITRSLSQVDTTTMRLDRSATFWKSLLSTKTPYDEFHHLFKTVPKDQFPINDFSCALSRDILLQGRMYISQGWFCFYSNIFGWETQVIIDCSKIVSITREKTAYVVPNAVMICTEDDKHFFSSFLSRETVYKLLFQVWEEATAKSKNLQTSQVSISDSSDIKVNETELLEGANVEQDDNQGDEESNGNDDTNENCQEEGDDFCLQCQENRQSSLCSSKENLNEMAEPDQVLTRHTSRDSLSRRGNKKAAQEIQLTRLSMCARLVVMLASVAEMSYSYVQVSIQLIRRLSSEKLFILFTSFIIVLLMLSSCYLYHRISILEPRILGTNLPQEQLSVNTSLKQILKLRQDVFNAEVTRFKTIIAANLEAITQVRESLKMLQENLKEQYKRSCSLPDEFCVPL